MALDPSALTWTVDVSGRASLGASQRNVLLAVDFRATAAGRFGNCCANVYPRCRPPFATQAVDRPTQPGNNRELC